jgi:transmembrane sensor
VADDGPEDGDALREEARAWIVRLTSGEATDADAWNLASWRTRSQAHEAAYRDAVRLWRRLAPAAGLQARLDQVRQQRRRVLRRRTLIAGGAAAAIGGVLAGGRRLDLVPSLGEVLAEYHTGTGEQRRLALADGSIVEMNTRTSLSVRFSDTQRRIDLAGGEAIFTVTHDPARPFTVAAADGETRAIGTVFDVRQDPDEVCVTCLQGAVHVQRIESVDLPAVQQVRYTPRGLDQPRAVDADTVVAWRQGLLIFRDEPLGHVVATLNRYRPGLIVLTGESGADRRVSGVFHLDRLDEVLAQIARLIDMRPLSLPGRIVILR